MAVMANPRLVAQLEKYGAEDVTKCYHCGNCSATCPFSKEPFLIPRKSMRYLQMGLEEKLKTTLEPWLCYYCGECSEQCPREAEPGETMMSMRRWLIGQYDVLGLARLFMRSAALELAFVVVIAVLTGAGFLAWGFLRGQSLADYQNFMPASDMHLIDIVLGFVFIGLVVLNVVHMWYLTMGGGRDHQARLGLYARNLFLLPWHFFTQRRYSECTSRRPWFMHLCLALGYVTMLVLIMLFLHQMQSPHLDWRVHIPGYLATAGLLAGGIYALSGRMTKSRNAVHKSHHTDWVFLLMLVYIALTGIIQHLLHRLGLGTAANITYMLHMMGVVPWMMRFPFSKWAHMFYRPLAMYFARVQTDAILARAQEPAGAKVVTAVR